ncbi:hypothetical protein HDF26_005263 [Pedobacter cryoconitis]|uniref:Putative auto-transporter adhesin head GIN domain-containing protein n=1 Tax=Pedobacter cryoconitis TaxID=188932 RepID=A0A7W9DZ10_9SPHI|nr:DUF2807 domain-containing protein [Pedobacter cryoconitis]MBB5636787.1 hypothetical protein [Pedobacter cryoconitis]MBB6274781.1 hypothetical protein [Pedobacter cryoconitis]
MKNSLKTLVTSAMTAIILSATVFSSIAAEKVVPVVAASAKMDIKRVIVQGNTRVHLVQSKNEWVSVEESEMDKISVKQMGNTLTVSSSEESPVTVTVYVKDLYRISALDNSEVSTIGTFNLAYLQVILRDNAVAHIKANTESMYTDMDGLGSLELAGTTESHTIKNSGLGSLKTEKLAALRTDNLPVESRLAMNVMKAKVKKANTGDVKK